MTTLHDARIQAHDAILAISALGRTLLPRQPDDSHQSFMWSDEYEAFVQEAIDGRLRPGLRLRDLTLLLIEDKVHELPLRATHDVRMLARMYATAVKMLERARAKHDGASPVRLWPHHFDVAILVGTIGVGFLAGDEAIDEPYWYVYNTPVPDPLPSLSTGEWFHGHWTGAVLKGDPDAATIEKFLDEAIAAVR